MLLFFYTDRLYIHRIALMCTDGRRRLVSQLSLTSSSSLKTAWVCYPWRRKEGLYGVQLGPKLLTVKKNQTVWPKRWILHRHENKHLHCCISEVQNVRTLKSIRLLFGVVVTSDVPLCLEQEPGKQIWIFFCVFICTLSSQACATHWLVLHYTSPKQETLLFTRVVFKHLFYTREMQQCEYVWNKWISSAQIKFSVVTQNLLYVCDSFKNIIMALMWLHTVSCDWYSCGLVSTGRYRRTQMQSFTSVLWMWEMMDADFLIFVLNSVI